MSDLSHLLERFRRGPEVVATAATGVAGSQLDFAPGPDKWSIRLIVCHLADSEIVGATRFRWVLAENEPALPNYDEKAWAAGLGYASRRFSQALELFRRMRAENYELLKDLPEAAFARAGIHFELGRLTLLDLLRIYAEHAENHARQMMNNRKLFKEAKGSA
ncbi:MAG: DinB family protein [Bryobacteraceae bacterium]|nr:DinB family protein [Bryobacteraceae bacterium]